LEEQRDVGGGVLMVNTEAQQVPEMEADLAFETFAADAPSGRDVLVARQNDLNLVGRAY